MHTHTHRYTFMQRCIHAYAHTHIYASTSNINTSTHTHILTHRSSHTHILLYVCMKSHVNTSTHVHTWSIIQMEFIFICGVRSRLRCFCVFGFAYDCQLVLKDHCLKSLSFFHQLPWYLCQNLSCLFSVPLICVSILSQIPHCLAHSRFIMHF